MAVQENTVGQCGCGGCGSSHSHHEHHEHHHEDGCGCGHDHGNTENSKRKIVQIIIATVIFGAGCFLSEQPLVQFIIFLIAYLVVGAEVLWEAVKNIFKGQIFDENFLMTLATVGAFAIGEYPEGVMVMLLFQLGEIFQSYAVSKSRKSITSLMNIRPDYANIQVGNEIKQVSPEEVAIGDRIVVKAGEKIPLDGIVLEGKSFVDTSALTGESVPREVQKGSEVLSGCINNSGLLQIQVTKHFGDSTVSRILDLVEHASSKKADAENFITKFARYYTPVVVLLAALLAIVPPLVLGDSFSGWIYRALTFLMISCPCALVISVPLSFFGGIGGASRAGILVKGGNYLEVLSKLDAVVFDKTGTLTKGVFEVNEIHPVNISREELLTYAAMGESYSNHPISLSIQKAYRSEFEKEIDQSRVEHYEEISGHGIKAVIDGKTVLLGNQKMMESIGLSVENQFAATVVHLAIDRVYAGYLLISDQIKEDSARAIQQLKSIGIKKTVMLTGDSKAVGEQTARELGLDQAYTELLPADKVAQLETLLKEVSAGRKLAFVGDGINDAPVLARADIGVAMGGLGSDAAIEAADVVIMTDEPSKIATAIQHSKRTLRIVKQNIVFALGVKGIVLILGAFGIATMWAAVFVDVGVSICAILNAVRALKLKE